MYAILQTINYKILINKKYYLNEYTNYNINIIIMYFMNKSYK